MIFRFKFLIVCALTFSVACFAFAQVTPEQQKISTRVMDKIQMIDLYNQLLPVLMTPTQIKAVLPTLEKYRSEFRKLELSEHNLLKALEKDLDASLADIKKSETVPEQAVVKKYLAHLQAFNITRQMAFTTFRNQVFAILKKELNAGQIAAAANTFAPRNLEGETDPKKFTEDQKLAYWMDTVLFEPLTYGILLELSKK